MTSLFLCSLTYLFAVLQLSSVSFPSFSTCRTATGHIDSLSRHDTITFPTIFFQTVTVDF